MARGRGRDGTIAARGLRRADHRRATSTGQHGVEDFTAVTINLAVANGIDHEVLTADEVRRRFGVFSLTDEVGYFEPTAGYLRAAECVAGQLELATRLGASLRRDERVVTWAVSDAGVRVETVAEHYLADRLVLAAGPWMPELVPSLAPRLTVHRQVQYWFAVSTNFEQCAALPVFIWLHGADPGAYVYGFPAIDGPSGGIKVATETFSTATTPQAVDRDVSDEEVAAMFEAHLRGRLADVTPTCLRHAVCLYTVTPDFGFLVDVLPGHPNVVVASPCSGHGFKHSAAIGETVAALALGEPPPLDVSHFSLARLGTTARCAFGTLSRRVAGGRRAASWRLGPRAKMAAWTSKRWCGVAGWCGTSIQISGSTTRSAIASWRTRSKDRALASPRASSSSCARPRRRARRSGARPGRRRTTATTRTSPGCDARRSSSCRCRTKTRTSIATRNPTKGGRTATRHVGRFPTGTSTPVSPPSSCC